MAIWWVATTSFVTPWPSPLDPIWGQGRLYTSTYPCARTPPQADAQYPRVRQQSELKRGGKEEEDEKRTARARGSARGIRVPAATAIPRPCTVEPPTQREQWRGQEQNHANNGLLAAVYRHSEGVTSLNGADKPANGKEDPLSARWITNDKVLSKRTLAICR